MPNVSIVAAFELGDPMMLVVLVKAYDAAVHPGIDASAQAAFDDTAS